MIFCRLKGAERSNLSAPAGEIVFQRFDVFHGFFHETDDYVVVQWHIPIVNVVIWHLEFEFWYLKSDLIGK